MLQQVINYFPRYSSDPSSQDYNHYYCIRLMLHHPFINPTDLLAFNGCVYGSYIDAFQACRQLHIYPDDFYTDLVADDQDTESEDNDESVCSEGKDGPLANFKIFARR